MTTLAANSALASPVGTQLRAAGSPAPATASDTGTAPAASGFSGGDFETFLKMLTTQIKHQDPLNPMEGSDFAVQLATFSGVEQQVRTNQLLEQLTTERAAGLGTLAGWIGREVRTTAPIAFDGTPVTLDVQPAAGATEVQLVAIDQHGREASRQTLNPTAAEILWDGSSTTGRDLPAGLYSFKLVSMKGDEILKTEAVGAYARVTGAELTSDGVRLTLPGGASTLETEVTALRDPA